MQQFLQPVGGHVMAHACCTRLSLKKGRAENRIIQVVDVSLYQYVHRSRDDSLIVSLESKPAPERSHIRHNRGRNNRCNWYAQQYLSEMLR